METQDLFQLCQQIARHLPGTWSLETAEYRNQIKLTDQDGLSFFIEADMYGHKGQLHVTGHSGGLYTFLGRDQKFPTINCALSRPPHAIAADISRRFLVPFTTLIAEASASKAASDCQKAEKCMRAEAMVEACDGLIQLNHTDYGYGTSISYHGGVCRPPFIRGDIYDNDVTMHLSSVPFPLAESILQTIAEHFAKEEHANS